jgi:TRAP-type C4-dicarboxylate transport system substrate-binding protein
MLLAVAANPVHAAKYKIRWLIGHPNLDFFEESAKNFKETVERQSHGDISVQIVTAENSWEYSDQGKPGPEIAKAVAAGQAEMGHSFTDVMGGMDHRLWAFDLPYLFRDYNHLEGVFEGPLGEQLLSGLREHQIEGLAFTYSGGANGVATRDREIRSPADLKGLRVAERADAAWLKSLGAVPVTLTHREDSALSLAQDDKIDAVVATWRRFLKAGLDPRFKYFNMANSSYLVSVTYINQKFYEGLPAEYQKLLKESVHASARIERARTIKLNEISKRQMVAGGVVPVYLSEENTAKFHEALRPVYKETLSALVGKDLIEKIRKTGAGPSPFAAEPAGR